MEIINSTEFCFDVLPLPVVGDKHRLTMLMKASFSYAGGTVQPADEQLPVLYADAMDSNGVVPVMEADNVPFKPRADVLVIGMAYAQQGNKVPFLDVRVRAADLDHTVRVYGDRQWQKTGMLSKLNKTRPTPFSVMALGYELAFGGQDPSSGEIFEVNPIGKGFIGSKSKKIEGLDLPNLEDPRQLIETWTDKPKPTGLGVRCKTWLPRVKLLGRYKETKKDQFPETPSDFKSAFYNSAQVNMQLNGYFKGNDAVELQNLSPRGIDRFNLPNLQPKITLKTHTETHTLIPVLDTLLCMADKQCFVCVWRAGWPIADLSAAEIDSVRVSVG